MSFRNQLIFGMYISRIAKLQVSFIQSILRVFEAGQLCCTSKGFHLLLDSCVHAEVKHELYVLLCVFRGDHLMRGQQNYHHSFT